MLQRWVRTIVAPILVGVLLAGCSNSGGSSQAPIPAPTLPKWASGSVTFNPAQAAAISLSAEFRGSDTTCAAVGCGVAPSGIESSPYVLHGVNWALSAGLTGTGKTIAIVDDGFLTTHQELAGKTISQTGALPSEGHGTFVASIAAGKKDGLGMHGVAPGASLHLTSYQPAGNNAFNMANVTNGTLAAANLKAVAQNNSWGFNIAAQTLQNYLNANPGASVAVGLNATIGYGSANWQTYINALDTFQQTGVVVWALSNNSSLASGDISAALPYFEPRLAEAWIAVANGYFEVNGNGNITRAVRLSAPCGLAARFCLAGDGTSQAAWNTSNLAYVSGTGTSFVAPQVSGAVALLAEAFPDLTPAEWTQRLLASADNSWFAAQGVPIAGTVDYGNGVTHAYSTEWGHGVLNIKAALSPIGTVAVLNGATVTTATRTSLDNSVVVSPTSYGDSLALALTPQPMAVFDSLNRAYTVSTGAAVAPRPATLLPRLGSDMALGEAGEGFSIRRTTDLGSAVGGAGGRASMLSMAGDSVLVASTAPVGSVAELTAYGFAGGHANLNSGTLAGGGVTLTLPMGSGAVRFGGSLAQEEGGVMGLNGGSAFNFGEGSAIGAVSLAVEQKLAPSLGLYGRVEYGAAARQAGTTAGMVTDVRGLTFSGVEVGAVFSGIAQDDDRLSLSMSQPLRIETGTIDMATPVGRRADGTILTRDSSVGLQSSGRQLDLGVNYAAQLDNRAALDLGVKYALDAGHVAGRNGWGMAVGYRQNF